MILFVYFICTNCIHFNREVTSTRLPEKSNNKSVINLTVPSQEKMRANIIFSSAPQHGDVIELFSDSRQHINVKLKKCWSRKGSFLETR